MSYCVNCGVELERSLKICPLCNTPVVNPNELQKSADETTKEALSPFPMEKGQVERVRRKDVAILVSTVVLSTIVVCGLLNLLVFNSLAWSLPIIGGGVLLWVILIPVIIYTRQSVYLSVLLDGVAMILYLFLITYLTDQNGWFLGLGVPIVVLLTGIIEAFILCYKLLPRSFLTVALYIFIALPVFCIGLEILIDRYIRDEIVLGWSALVLTVCIVVDITIITILSRRRLRNAVRRRLHF